MYSAVSVIRLVYRSGASMIKLYSFVWTSTRRHQTVTSLSGTSVTLRPVELPARPFLIVRSVVVWGRGLNRKHIQVCQLNNIKI